jgi:hypothetical protein
MSVDVEIKYGGTPIVPFHCPAKEQTTFHETRKFTSARYLPIAESSMYQPVAIGI